MSIAGRYDSLSKQEACHGRKSVIQIAQRHNMFKIAVFASGSGTNAENLIRHFNYELKGQKAKVELVVCNKPEAYVLTRARTLNVPTVVTKDTEEIIENLRQREIDLILLAGYLLKIPKELIDLYPDRIINLHPSLLPKYGGITLHLVDEEMDHGKILFQSSFALSDDETLESLEAKIHIREQADYPRIAEAYLNTH